MAARSIAMRIGVPKESKNHEYRVGMIPGAVRELTERRHDVWVEHNSGAHGLERMSGGAGILLGGIPGAEPAKVLIIGGGTVGFNACRMAVGLGARMVVIDRSAAALRRLDAHFQSRVSTVYASADAIKRHLPDADLVIGAVLIPGAVAPKLVARADLGLLRLGSVLVDVAIDQGGCFENSRPTSHDAPTFVDQGVVHYCVTNMPGIVRSFHPEAASTRSCST